MSSPIVKIGIINVYYLGGNILILIKSKIVSGIMLQIIYKTILIKYKG